MELISVEYLEESSKAIFCNVTMLIKPFWSKSFQITRRCYLEKWKTNGGYGIFPKWCDTNENTEMYNLICEEIILQYEKSKK